MITAVWVLFILILLNAFFAASEIALISLNDNKIKLMAERGNKKAVLLTKLLGEPSRFLATIQIGITLAGFLASAFAAESFADPLVTLLREWHIPLTDAVLKVTTVVFITLFLAYFTLVFGELVPKRIAMQKAEPVAFFVVRPLLGLAIMTSPFVKLLTLSTNFFVRMFGVDPHANEEQVTEEEIRMMVDVGEEKGAIDNREKIMINNIFEFNNKITADIMTHRIEVFSIPLATSLLDLIHLIHREKYSRIPVYEKNIDNIIGILHTKDLIPYIQNELIADFKLENVLRKPYFVPVQKKIDELFIEMQMTKTHLAILIDEYGGTAGIITIEDIVEEIVGNIFDEYDDEEVEFKKIDKQTYQLSGLLSLDELQNHLDIELPVDDYDTVSGFLIGMLGKIPLPGDTSKLSFRNLTFEITEVTEKRIEKVMLLIHRQNEDEAQK